MLQIQLWAFPRGGTGHVVLPRPQSWQASYVLSDMGSLQLTYPLGMPGIEVLSTYCDVETRYWNGSEWVCPPQGRFSWQSLTPDPVAEKGQPYRTYTMPSFSWLLKRVFQARFDQLDSQGNREFPLSPVGVVAQTLVSEAQEAGAMPDLSVDNQAGTLGYMPPYPPGKALFDILSEQRDQGGCEWLMQPDAEGQGRALTIYTSYGTDRSAGSSPVQLRPGRDVTSAPSTLTVQDLASTVLVLGDDIAHATVSNPNADQPYGDLMDVISAGGLSEATDLQAAGQARLAQGGGVRAQRTCDIRFSDASFLPFIDYTLGDTVQGPDESGDLAPMRVHQITLTYDQNGGLGGNLVLGDRFYEYEVRLQRRVQQLMGSSMLVGNGTLPLLPAPPILDNTPPPVSSAISAVSALTMVKLHWNGFDEDGDPVGAGFDHAEAERDTTASFLNPVQVGVFNSAGDLNDGPFTIGQVYYYRLIIVNQAGTRSTGSAAASVTIVGVRGPDIEVNQITANQMNVGTLSSITANLGTVNAGTINGVDIYGSVITSPKIRTDPGSSRLELGAGDGSRSPSTIWFYNASNERTGSISGDGSALSLIGPGSAGGLGQAEIDLDDGSVSIGTDSRGQVVIASSSTSITLPSANIGGPVVIESGTQIHGGLSVSGALSVAGSFTPASVNTSGSVTASGSGLFGGNLEVGTLSSSSAGSAARLVSVGSRYRFYLDSSLSKLKLNKRKIGKDYAVLDLVPKTWIDKTMRGLDKSYDRRSAGFVAEEVQALSQANDGLFDPLLTFDGAGNLQGLAYDRVSAYLIPVVRDMNERLAALEAR